MTWKSWAQDRCLKIQAAGLWRAPRDVDGIGPAGILVGPDWNSDRSSDRSSGRKVVSFASNDYLGLTAHPEVIQAAHRALDRWGTGAASARLIVGSRPIHTELEHEIARWKGAEKAALFPTGFQANLGVLSALGGPGTLICSDERNHASIVEGCRLARAEVAVYPHCDVAALDGFLAGVLFDMGSAQRNWRRKESAGRAIVVTDSVFSMDGDVAPLEEIVSVCASRQALLVIDEAHAVLGPEPPVAGGAEMLRVGTLSKFLGSIGGFVAGPAPLVDLIVNTSRPYIFTTATPPADSAAALAALGVLRSSEGAALKAKLGSHVNRIAPGHPSPIIPFVFGDEEAALAASDQLLNKGFLVPAIRPPTVAPGTSRLRVTLSAAHSEEQVDALASALSELQAAAAHV